MGAESDRRNFLLGGSALAGGLAAGTAGAQDKPPAKDDHAGHDRGKLVAGSRRPGDPPVPVETPDSTKLKWVMKNGAKEFHLYAQVMKREFLPDQFFDVWSYGAEPGPKGATSMPGMPGMPGMGGKKEMPDMPGMGGKKEMPDMPGMPGMGGMKEGTMPGPMIEVVEGDKVRIVVHNELPEPTVMHWHGIDVPNVMDGVEGMIQDPIPPGGMFAYEFTLEQNGTFFYHTHIAMQQGMGMVGLFIIHPKAAHAPAVDRDIALIIQEWAILPGSTIHNTMSMEFNLFTLNGRAAPYITPLVIKQGERVRIRLVNFSAIDHHPMHLHGMQFWITGTEAGRIPDTAWIPSNNVLVGVAQARDIEFVAKNPGDWVLHCHMFHHMMNFMSSMAGPMAGGSTKGMPAGTGMGTSMGMVTRGPALNPDFGAALGRGTGENTGTDRAVGNGPQPGQPGMTAMPGMPGMPGTGKTAPGFPQSMMGMEMYTPAQVKKLRKPETRGMRKNWFEGVEGLMTVVRVLPPELYDKVVSGKGEVTDGASVPGGTPGGGGHAGHEGMKMDPKKDPPAKKDEHEGHKK